MTLSPIPLILLVLALCGCQTINTVDEAIQKSLPATCAAVQAGYVAFTQLTVTYEIPEKVKASVQVAFESSAEYCADPENADTARALAVVAQASVRIASAIAAAEGAYPKVP